MAEKLTKLVSSTSKQVEDISKNRLGNAYKGFTRLPDWEEDDDFYKINILEYIDTDLVSVAPTVTLDEVRIFVSSDITTGSGSFSTVNINSLLTTYGMANWSRLLVSFDKLHKPYKVIYTHGSPIDASAAKAIVLRVDGSGNFQQQDATVTNPSSNVLHVDFKPQYGGTYLVGFVSTATIGTVSQSILNGKMGFPMYNYHASNTVRTYIGGGIAGDWMVSPSYKFNDNGSLYSTNLKSVTNETLQFNTGSAYKTNSDLTNLRTGIHTDFDASAAMYNTVQGFDVAEKKGIVRPDNSIFFPQYDTEETFVVATLGSTSNITLYALHVDGSEVSMGSPSSNYRVADYIAVGNLAGVLVKGTGSLTEKKKIRVIAFSNSIVNDTTRRGYKCFEYIHPGNVSIDATTNGGYLGTDFQVIIPGTGSTGSEYSFFAYSPDGVAPTVTATRSGTSITPTTTDKGNGWVLYTIAENAANTTSYRFKFVFNKNVFFGYYPYSPTYSANMFQWITHIPTVDDKDYGTSFKVPYEALQAYTGTSTAAPKISFMPLTEEPTTVTVNATQYKNITPGVYTTINPRNDLGVSAASLVTITSDKPIHVFVHNIEQRTDWGDGTHTLKPGGYGGMPNLYSATAVEKNATSYLNQYQIDVSESTTQTRSWARAFRVTTRLRDDGIINWDETNFRVFRQSPLKAEIRYSTDNTNWGAALTLTNGAELPTPNVANAEYIEIKFYTNQNGSAVGTRVDDTWVGGFTIL